MNIHTLRISAFGSEIRVDHGRYFYDDEGNKVRLGLRPSYMLDEIVLRDPEGRPLTRTCVIKSWSPYQRYSIENRSYDDYVVDEGYGQIFDSKHSYSLPL